MTRPFSTTAHTVARLAGRSRRILAAAVSIVLVVLGLVACTESPPSSPSATTSPSLSASPTASYKPADSKGKAQNVPLPVMPAEAKSHTKEGLQAFMKHWVGLLSYAYETGDTVPLFEVTGGGCKTCNDVKVTLTDTYDRGGWILGGTLTFISADSAMVQNQYGQLSGVITYRQDAIAFLDSGGKTESKFEADAKPASKLFLVVEREGGWELGDVGNAPTAKS